MWNYLFYCLFVPCFLTYFIQHTIVAFFYKTQNLKKRYKADWALVTGASSGVYAHTGHWSVHKVFVLSSVKHQQYLRITGSYSDYVYSSNCRDRQVHCAAARKAGA